jgi:hypothetical protein
MIDDDDKLADLARGYLDRIEDAEHDGHQAKLAIALVVQEVGNDPLLAPSVSVRTGRAAAKKQERLEQLCLVLARFALSCDRGEVRSRAAYLGSSLKRLVISWGEDWNESRSIRR